MAHKKGEGSTQNGRDSNAKYLGVKLFGGQAAKAGMIIIRQRGSKYHLGENVYYGKDWTVHAQVAGTIKFHKGRRGRTFVNVVPYDEVPETPVPPKKQKPNKPNQPVIDINQEKEEKAVAAPPVVEEKVEVKAAAAPPPVVEEKVVAKAAAPASEKDNLKKHIEGVGPKIEGLLHEAGILTFAKLADTEVDKIKEILAAAGKRYQMHDPTSWPLQAGMARDGKWDELKKWQDEHDKGKM